MNLEDILIEGSWTPATASGTFHANNPSTRQAIGRDFPISSWQDCERALAASVEASRQLQTTPAAQIAEFLEGYATKIETRAQEIAALAHEETALPLNPRLLQVELPRTTTQLRQAAAAAREGSWVQAVIDTKSNIRSYFAPIGPVVVFGPNNFPLAFNGISGGDFAAAIAAGNPVIAKAHPLHPGTSKALAECASEALRQSGLPPATVQMLYHLSNEDGLRLVADPRVGASSFTGSRTAGMRLKAAADKVGRPIYLEMSSINPIVYLPGALRERAEELVAETANSALAAAGQFCTSPNLLFLLDGPEAVTFARQLTNLYSERAPGPLFSQAGVEQLDAGVKQLVSNGAKVLTGGSSADGRPGYCYGNTVLQTSAELFLAHSDELQREAFGNATTIVIAKTPTELLAALESLEGNLTGCIYSSTAGEDDALYTHVAAILRSRVGRLLNDKMPTGVALSPAMNHGGPFPATAHPAFTAVGIPRSMLRFGTLQCFDNVRHHRLPPALQDQAPNPQMWRQMDGAWVRG